MNKIEQTLSFKSGTDQVVLVEKDIVKEDAIDLNIQEQKIENEESKDVLSEIAPVPVKSNYENNAFVIDDVELNPNINHFDRMERSGTMKSIASTTSKSSRSSVNCTTGRVRCPNLRLKKFFSYKSNGGFQKASEDIKALILPDKDGAFIGNWLLVEISIWDLHREKIVLLTERTLIIVTYDFIRLKMTDYKRINLSILKKVSYGNLKYPKVSLMDNYDYGAVKLSWGSDNLSFFEKWNPLTNIPLVMFTSHHILYNEKEKETEIYNCDEFIASLEYAISKLEPSAPGIEFKEEPIEINSYASLVSVLYNQNWFGFQLDRNGVNF